MTAVTLRYLRPFGERQARRVLQTSIPVCPTESGRQRPEHVPIVSRDHLAPVTVGRGNPNGKASIRPILDHFVRASVWRDGTTAEIQFVFVLRP